MSILLKTLLGDLTDSTSPLFDYKSILDGLDINIGDVNLNEGVLDYNGKRYRLCEEGTCCQGNEKECEISDCPSKGDTCCDGSFIVKFTPEEASAIRYFVEENGIVVEDEQDGLDESILDALPTHCEIERAKLAGEEQAIFDYRTAQLIGLVGEDDEVFETKQYAKSQVVPLYINEANFENFKV